MRTACFISGGRGHRRDGSAVIVIMVLLGMMLIFVGANLKTLYSLERELKLIEKRQIQRIQRATVIPPPAAQASTNAPGSALRPLTLGLNAPLVRAPEER